MKTETKPTLTIVPEHATHVAFINGGTYPRELIATAPELLEALKEVKAVFEASGAVEPFKAQYEVVCQAIAKAEGR